jgi:hypothetical protein
LEGYTRVTLKLDTRTVVGARLTYYASDERYVMSAAVRLREDHGPADVRRPVRWSCRETTGRTLTFYKSTD